MHRLPKSAQYASPRIREGKAIAPYSALQLFDRRPRQPRFARFHRKGVVEGIPRRRDVRRGCPPVVVAQVVADERTGDPELNVEIEPLVVVDVDLRDERLEPGLLDQEMQVRRPVVVAPG